ncbi:hemin uptake protein HemP [Methylococcus sp. EFPC2]|uniref:hemin uptake protein HemP n=1 Tax=Methylococcus sp. EFPC2 TaxID=2812648 RepID=UPI00196799FA|nr:hemin uptake protein HemP [Methylococcus sp. EFPC2]QSA96937.1 hemin uptake protein HemP [Methylococcus sp. EFPC2]
MNKNTSYPIAAPPVSESEAGVRKQRRRISSSELLGVERELVIEHGGSEYRLRITSNDKLILTK